MDLHDTYKRFQHEQVHAHDDSKRTRYDGFGAIIDTPTVEGFDPTAFIATLSARSAQSLAQLRVLDEGRKPGVNDEARKLFNFKKKRGW